MWLHVVVVNLLLPFFALAHPIEWQPSHIPDGRDFFGLIESDDLPTTTATVETWNPATSLTSFSLNLPSLSSTSLSKVVETGSSVTTPSSTFSSTASGDSQTTAANSWTSTSAILPTVSVDYITPEESTTPPSAAGGWKVIGISIIAVTFVATVILAIAFFDSWWGFLRDVVCGKRYSDGEENLIPDWEKSSWEYKIASEDGHRYPTMTTLDDIVTQGREHSEKIRPRSEAMFLTF
ncbi:uncharacterized protein LACBIDRAFT_301179 [Laccaria bicolor S238N-H82]|uniref:Predicted protein n=1 Tax=Laccaria bicolor (strain S238N-H82 / ATCC MYA-4686) TaxID=486041 RepID=B0CRI9_LACBS|nr:uncharacterized protein LACBIDRAFT_301179 [Laccaria bicolor S238N-H82]EDR15210.1 predicted protein [Laccaria bicolor S238N-H82]|eukprot:XP_001873418.1 predicted protein [Laccaria bicolor S238N-H82]